MVKETETLESAIDEEELESAVDIEEVQSAAEEEVEDINESTESMNKVQGDEESDEEAAS